MILFGKEMTKKEFYRRFGDVSQAGGIRHFWLMDGKQKGIEAYEFITGAGLRFTVLADRCLDIGWADYRGIPVSFISKAGVSNSLQFEHRGEELHRTFAPGLLTTCGLRNIGKPCVVDGEEFAQHGRIAHAPAERVSVESRWEGDEYYMAVSGSMREASLYAENLVLERRIETRLGSRKLKVRDVVTNYGHRDEGICLMYHMNFGYPIVSENASLVIPPAKICNNPLDWRPDHWNDSLKQLSAPMEKTPGGFRLEFEQDGEIEVGIDNPTLDVMKGIRLRFSKNCFPKFSMWRNLVQGDYVVGLEPCTTFPAGRKEILEKNGLIMLPSMGSYTTEVELEII